VHAHNRLIASVCIDEAMRREVAREIGQRLAAAAGPVRLLVPTRGIEGWDRPGAADARPRRPGGAVRRVAALRAGPNTQLQRLDAHINDAAFADAALAAFDGWLAAGLVKSAA
jgi:uncharacterized protein (UPF0261 family)